MLRICKIIIHIAVLYSIYLIGNWIQDLLNLFIPGSVIGMVLLFVMLQTNIIKVAWIEEGTRFIINHLVLFFIPTTVGIISYFTLFSGKGFLLVIIVLVSTALVMAGSGMVSQWLISRQELKND